MLFSQQDFVLPVTFYLTALTLKVYFFKENTFILQRRKLKKLFNYPRFCTKLVSFRNRLTVSFREPYSSCIIFWILVLHWQILLHWPFVSNVIVFFYFRRSIVVILLIIAILFLPFVKCSTVFK